MKLRKKMKENKEKTIDNGRNPHMILAEKILAVAEDNDIRDIVESISLALGFILNGLTPDGVGYLLDILKQRTKYLHAVTNDQRDRFIGLCQDRTNKYYKPDDNLGNQDE